MSKIAFIVPCYNTGHLMEKCFNSLKNQSFTDIEFIFVNDGSTDSTEDTLANFVANESRAKIINQINGGITAARLAGIKSTTAEFVTFLDSDDYVDISAAEEALSLFQSNKNIDSTLYTLTYETNSSQRDFNYRLSFPTTGEEIIRNTIPSWRVSTNGFYRREHALKAYETIDFKSTNSDEVAGRLIFENCQNVALLKSRYYYVQHSNSTSKKPSQFYATRLTSAQWLRNRTTSKYKKIITSTSAELHYINELCNIILKLKHFSKAMDESTKKFWCQEIKIHRNEIIKNVKTSSSKMEIFSNLSSVKKLVFIYLWPLMR